MALTNQTIGAGGITGGTHTIQLADTAERVRLYDLAFLTEGAAGGSEFTTSRPGVLAGMLGYPTGSGLSINVAPGAGVVERGTLVGSYVVSALATGVVTLATADPTNPRIDRVDLQVLDGALGDNSGTSLTRYVVTTGVASGTPAVPAAPINSTPVTQVLLPANTITVTTGMLSDKRRSAGLRGANRLMLGGDALSDVGFLTGERRMRQLSGYSGTPLVTDYWGSDSAWHGTNVLNIAGTWQNGTSNISIGAGATVACFIVTVPDPGWAYTYTVQAAISLTSNTEPTPLLSIKEGSTGSTAKFSTIGSSISGNAPLFIATPPSAVKTGALSVLACAVTAGSNVATALVPLPLNGSGSSATWCGLTLTPA